MLKRFLSCVLTICVLLSCIVTYDIIPSSAQAATIDYGLVDNVQYGQILHCWNWSFDNIRKNLPLIASQGFTAIQTSPIQASKESTRESWSSVANSAWVFYQPISFSIEQNSRSALGTKSQFESMCEEAHKYGIKVIVDTVFNHMANDSTENTINPQITSDIKDDTDCWNSVTWNTSNWEDRYDVTHNCLSGLPDLKTSNTKIQNYAINFLKECIDAGADGFRFDAAKHIETPSDSSGVASDFWPNVLNTATYHAQQTRGITPYYYGEILGNPGGGLSISAYTDYMSVTDNATGNNIRKAIEAGNASGACVAYTSNGAATDKAVQWNESHDTYYADNESIWVSNDNMKKTWAIVGTRAQVCGLYLARPENNETTMLGDGDITAWADVEVKAINRFKNYFAGHPEYLACSGNIVYNERGNTGVVLVNATGGSTSVSVPAYRMYDGVYTDAITGNHFSVSNGTISGTIGESGIAVVYSYPSTVSVDKSSQAFRGDTLDVTLTYDEATSGTYSINDKDTRTYTNGDVVSLGCGVEYGDDVTLLVTASGGTTTDSVLHTYKKLHPDTELKIYFDNSSKNWSEVYAYIYNDDGEKVESWPGLKMDFDSSLGLYTFDVPQGFETSKVVFSNGNGSQTPTSGGYEFNSYTSIYKDGYFYGYNTGVEDRLYFKPSENWLSDGARFAVYVWNGNNNSWVDFTDDDSDGIYVAQLPSGIWKECIFARMNPSAKDNNWDNVWNRTGDLGISNNHNYFKIDEGWDTSSGSWSIIDTSVVGSSSEAFLSGSFNNWSKVSEPFVYTSHNTAVATVDLPAGEYTFKLFKNDFWFGNPGTINDTTSGVGWRMCKNDAENCTLEASGGKYTFTLNTETLKITVDYEPKEVVSTLPVETSIPTSIETTPISTEAETSAQSTVKAGYYLVGTINGENCWSVSSLTEDRLFVSNPYCDGEYMLDCKLDEGDEVKVVCYNGEEITQWYNSSGDNYSIGSSKAGECTVYFRPEGNDSWTYYYFTVQPKTVKETTAETVISTVEPTSEPTENSLPAGYYIVGTLKGENLWEVNTLTVDRLLSENAYASGEYMTEYEFSLGDELKVVYYDGSKITDWYNNGGDNYSIGEAKVGKCTVYFRPEGNSSWSYYYFTVIPNEISETEASTEEPTQEPTQTLKPNKITNIVASPTDTNIGFTWDSFEGAVKYWVYKYNDSTDTWASAASSYTNSAIVKLLDADTEYRFKVICKLDDGTLLPLDEADIITAKTNPKVATTNISGVADVVEAYLEWDVVEGATKYWVYKATSESGPFYIYKSSYINSLTVKKLRPDDDYYFRVVALTYNNGIPTISDVDASPTVHIRTTSATQITTTLNSVTSSTASISWPQFKNADKYWLLYSTTTADTSVKDAWTSVVSTTDISNLNYTFKKLNNNTTYYFTVCARYTDSEGLVQTVYYIPCEIRTPYSDNQFIKFTPVSDTSVTLTLPDDLNIVKAWIYAYDENGEQIVVASTTTNSVTLRKLGDYTKYTYQVKVLDNSGKYGFITPTGGECYHS